MGSFWFKNERAEGISFSPVIRRSGGRMKPTTDQGSSTPQCGKCSSSLPHPLHLAPTFHCAPLQSSQLRLPSIPGGKRGEQLTRAGSETIMWQSMKTPGTFLCTLARIGGPIVMFSTKCLEGRRASSGSQRATREWIAVPERKLSSPVHYIWCERQGM